MNTNLYCVRYQGRILPSFDRARVRIELERQFGMSERQRDALIGNKKLLIRRSLSKERSIKIAARLRACGIDAVSVRQRPSTERFEASTPQNALLNKNGSGSSTARRKSLQEDSFALAAEKHRARKKYAGPWLVLGVTGLFALSILVAFFISAPSLLD